MCHTIIIIIIIIIVIIIVIRSFIRSFIITIAVLMLLTTGNEFQVNYFTVQLMRIFTWFLHKMCKYIYVKLNGLINNEKGIWWNNQLERF